MIRAMARVKIMTKATIDHIKGLYIMSLLPACSTAVEFDVTLEFTFRLLPACSTAVVFFVTLEI